MLPAQVRMRAKCGNHINKPSAIHGANSLPVRWNLDLSTSDPPAGAFVHPLGALGGNLYNGGAGEFTVESRVAREIIGNPST